MKSPRATLKMIAEMSGVSRGTVDRVLNKRGKVRPEAARLVEEIARTLNYRPNTVAKSLATHSRDMKICVILHIQGNFFFDEVINGVERAAAEIKDFGISVSVKRGLNFDPECQLRNIDEAIREGCRAVVLVPINDPRVVAKVNEVSAAGIPVVFLTSYLEGTEYLCHVGCDYFKAGRIAAELFHLLSGGRANIGVITPPFTLLGVNLRIKGMQSAMESEYPGMRMVEIREVPSDEDLAYSFTFDMLREHPEIDCLFYSTGGLAGGLRAIRELKLYRSLKIVALDQTKPILDAIRDRGILATICQEPEAQGYTAIRVVFDHLVAHAAPAKKNWLINPTIKIRQSF